MTELNQREKHTEAFLAASIGKMIVFGVVISLPLLVLWLALTLPVYGIGPELPRIIIGMTILAFSGALLAVCRRMEYHVMSLPGVAQSLPISFAAASFTIAAVLVVMAGAEPPFLALGQLIRRSVLAAPALVFLPAAMYSIAHGAALRHLVMRSTKIDFLYLVGRRHLVERLEANWDGPREFGEPLSLLLLRFRPDDRHLSLAAVNESPPQAEILVTALNIVDRSIRKNDTAGQYSSDSIWVILGRTGADNSKIPRDRLHARLESDVELAAALKAAGLVVAGGVVSYRKEMESPHDLIDAVEDELRRAPPSIPMSA